MSLAHSSTNMAREGYEAKFSGHVPLYYVFEAERAVTGQTLAFAPATQVLSVWPLWIDVALCYCTGTTCFVASLEEAETKGCDVV